MQELLETLAAWRADGVSVGRAVVVRTFGSAPRPEGAVLLAASDGRIAGSVSGGCVEGAAVEEIAAARTAGRSRVIRYGISDEQAWDVGLACGGTIDVLVEPSLPAEVEAAAREAGREGRVAVTPLPEEGAGSPPEPPLIVHPGGSLEGSTGDEATDGALLAAAADALLRGASRTVELAGRSYLLEVFAPRPRLVVVGAVQVAIPLVALAHTLGYETVVVDARPAFATRERFPEADRIVAGWPDEAAGAIGLGPADAVVVLSHDVKFDEPAIAIALERRCRYVGAVGSRRTREARRARLAGAGLPEEDLDRLHSPIGLDLGGRAPAETALAIMAEVVARRYGAVGGSLRDVATRARENAFGAGAPR